MTEAQMLAGIFAKVWVQAPGGKRVRLTLTVEESLVQKKDGGFKFGIMGFNDGTKDIESPLDYEFQGRNIEYHTQ